MDSCVIVRSLHTEAAAMTELVKFVVGGTRHALLEVPDRTLHRTLLAV